MEHSSRADQSRFACYLARHRAANRRPFIDARPLLTLAVLSIAACTQPTAVANRPSPTPLDSTRPTAGFAPGVRLPAPTQLRATDARRREISCHATCSPFELRQPIVQISWPEQTSSAAAPTNTQALRLDIVGGASRFADGNFGTVRLSAIPSVHSQPNVGVDLQAVKKQVKPALIQRVEGNRVVPRDPALPLPEILKQERLSVPRPQLSSAAEAALKQDTESGAFGRIQAIAQSLEVRRSIPHRSLVVEGMQPGLTYKVRLVQERSGTAANLAEDICRIPVCPADLVPPPQ